MRLIFFLTLFFTCAQLKAQKIFNQPNAKGEWQYIYPFTDKSYVLAIQYNINLENTALLDKNSFIYFGHTTENTDKIFWKENLSMQVIKDNVRYEDYNNDGIKDLALFIATGSRGSNEYYNLYLINSKKHTLIKVNGFDEITNPTYNKKHGIIVGYGYAGTNYYSLYKLDKKNKIHQIGSSFEDNDELDLDDKITELLKRYKK